MTDKTDKHVKRAIDALKVLRQKVEAACAALKAAPSLRSISSLGELPEAEAKDVEDRLWEVFSYGEYYVEKVMSDLEDPILSARNSDLSELVAFRNQKYKPLVKKIRELIPNMKHAPSREYVEDDVVFLEYIEKDETGEWIMTDPYTPSEIDDHMDMYEWYVLRVGVRETAEIYAELSAENLLVDDAQSPAKDSDSSKNQNIKIASASEKSSAYKDVFDWVGMAAGNYTDAMSDNYDRKETWVERIDLPLYKKITGKPYFKPDDWVANKKDLSPIIVPELKKIPVHIILRVHEIHDSYIFSNWMAVIALSRSVLEHALVDEKSLVKIENLYVYDNDGKKEYRGLWELIKDAEKTNPELVTSELAKSMRHIKDLANHRVMHPPRPLNHRFEKVRRFPLQQRDAKECIEKIFEIIGALYGAQH